MRQVPIVLVALLAALPLGGVAQADAGNCNVYTYASLGIARTYYAWVSQDPVSNPPEIWEESNSIPGLQRVHSPCAGGATMLPPDTCITHGVVTHLVTCAIAFASR